MDFSNKIYFIRKLHLIVLTLNCILYHVTLVLIHLDNIMQFKLSQLINFDTLL